MTLIKIESVSILYLMIVINYYMFIDVNLRKLQLKLYCFMCVKNDYIDERSKHFKVTFVIFVGDDQTVKINLLQVFSLSHSFSN